MRAKQFEEMNPDARPVVPHPAPLDRQPQPTDSLTEREEPDSTGTASESSGTESGSEASTIDPMLPDDEGEDEEEEDMDGKPHGKPLPISNMIEEFREYCDAYPRTFLPFTREQITSIRLLATLKMKKAPLNTFAEVLEWHLKATNQLAPHESLKDSYKFTHQKPLMQHLLKRYNLEPMVPRLKKLTLPHSGAVVTIPYRDAKDCIVSLHTDPRIKDKHYLFRHRIFILC